MAIIQDNEEFKIKITPEYTNWWSYCVEFFYKDKSLFNPEIMNSGMIKADEYSRHALLPMLEKAIECNTPNEKFTWNEWEDEACIMIEYKKFNTLGDDGFFIFDAFVSEYFFKNGNSNTMNQPVGLKLMMIYRDQLKKFYQDLRNEILSINDTLREDYKS